MKHSKHALIAGIILLVLSGLCNQFIHGKIGHNMSSTLALIGAVVTIVGFFIYNKK